MTTLAQLYFMGIDVLAIRETVYEYALSTVPTAKSYRTVDASRATASSPQRILASCTTYDRYSGVLATKKLWKSSFGSGNTICVKMSESDITRSGFRRIVLNSVRLMA